MILYRLHILPGEGEGEGEDHSLWFSSLKEAKSRRAEVIRENTGHMPSGHEDHAIDRVHVADRLKPKELLLAVLNRRFVTQREQVVAPHRYPERKFDFDLNKWSDQ